MPESWEAYQELAIHFEHRAKDLRRPAKVVRQALAGLRRANRLGTIAAAAYRRQHKVFQHRLDRLERKAGRAAPLALETESRS